MKINDKIVLQTYQKKIKYRYGKKRELTKMEAFILTVLAKLQKDNNINPIFSVLKEEFSFNEKLASFYVETIIKFLHNIRILKIHNNTLNSKELTANKLDIEINPQVLEGIENNKFIGIEQEKRNISKVFSVNPLNMEIEIGKPKTEKKATFLNKAEEFNEARFKIAEENEINNIKKENIFIEEELIFKEKNNCTYDVEIEIDFKTQTMIENIFFEFIEKNNLQEELQDYLNKKFENTLPIVRNYQFFTDFNEIKKIVKNNETIKIFKDYILKYGSQKINIKNMKNISFYSPTYLKIEAAEYLKKLETSEVLELKKTVLNSKYIIQEILNNRKKEIYKVYPNIKDLLNEKEHLNILKNYPDLIDQTNINIFIKSKPTLDEILKIKNEKNITKMNLSDYSDQVWKLLFTKNKDSLSIFKKELLENINILFNENKTWKDLNKLKRIKNSILENIKLYKSKFNLKEKETENKIKNKYNNIIKLNKNKGDKNVS